MKVWTKGMFPPDAQFPAGYHFGDDNVRDALCPLRRVRARGMRGRAFLRHRLGSFA